MTQSATKTRHLNAVSPYLSASRRYRQADIMLMLVSGGVIITRLLHHTDVAVLSTVFAAVVLTTHSIYTVSLGYTLTCR